MNILHYIEKKGANADLAEEYMPALADCMAGMAENSVALSVKDVIMCATKTRPDIVHIHSCWSLNAWRVERWCRKHRIPVVLSPHRKLEPWHIDRHYWLAKLPMLIIFQKGIIKRANAIQTTTRQEQSNMALLYFHPLLKDHKPWNKRLETVKNFITDGTTTDRQMAFDMNALYQKVIDSYPFLAMDEKDKTAENALLRRGLAQDKDSAMLSGETMELIKSLTAASWRKILLHSHDEGIMEEIRKGISETGGVVPELDTNKIKRFDKEGTKNTSPLKSDKARKKQLRLEEISEEERATDKETRICTMFINLKQEMSNGTISKRHIADTYTAIRFTEYDEDKVERMLRRLGMRKFSGRIIQIMKESLGLEDGFIPFKPTNDGKTQKTRNILLKADIL